MEDFYRKSEQDDHEIALQINRRYDFLRIIGHGPSEAQLEAERMTYDSFGGGRKFSPEVGFDQVIAAKRWLRYREQYVQSLEPVYLSMDESGDPDWHGLDLYYYSYAEKYDQLKDEHSALSSYVNQQNPTFIKTLAKIENARRTLERDPRSYLFDPTSDISSITQESYLFDPLKFERDHAAESLYSVLNEVSDEHLTYGFGKETSTSFTYPAADKRRMKISYGWTGNTERYIIEDRIEGAYSRSAVYYIAVSSRGISVIIDSEDATYEADVIGIIRLAGDLERLR